MKPSKRAKLVQVSAATIGLMFLLLPLHAVLTTWAGANLGHIDLFRIWKELLLMPLTLGILWLVVKDKELRKSLLSNKLIWLIAAYSLLHVAVGLFALQNNNVNEEALIYALLINLRFLGFFVVCLIIASKSNWLISNWRQLIIWPATVVVLFGLLQQFVLPANFLNHFGYGPDTIPAMHTVDRNPEYLRLQSSLRGPNPLGAYLVLVITLAGASIITQKQRRASQASFLLGAMIVLFFSYSRSAWLGLIASLFLLIYWLLNKPQARRYLILSATCLVLIIGGLAAIYRNNTIVENTLLHTSQVSRSPDDSNEVRIEAWSKSIKSVIKEPWGRGPGTAGPASFRNNQPTHIAENYYIQIGQEVGAIGLVLFLAISYFVVKELWKVRTQKLSLILLASFAGLSIVNMLSHAWTDDTLAYLWWGLAGIALAPAIIKQKANHVQTTKKAKT
ncbi:MAG TPA: O-antigen ligase family protein [Candidatus Saccharimonadales bacterium]|nr:O-antigen ligase family protein [Candidatus Saccharimonadales bacterium]